MRSSGHTVHFNNTNPLTLNGIRIFGCKWGAENENANITISIWDDGLQTLYQDQVPYAKISVNKLGTDNKCSGIATWADIPLPGYAVKGIMSRYLPIHPRSARKGTAYTSDIILIRTPVHRIPL